MPGAYVGPSAREPNVSKSANRPTKVVKAPTRKRERPDFSESDRERPKKSLSDDRDSKTFLKHNRLQKREIGSGNPKGLSNDRDTVESSRSNFESLLGSRGYFT